MLSKPVSARLILALLLASLLAWAGHASAQVAGAGQVDRDAQQLHGHGHGDGALGCAVCVDHPHSALTGDHVHETPYLAGRLRLAVHGEPARLPEGPRYAVPASPVYLIERPPRPAPRSQGGRRAA